MNFLSIWVQIIIIGLKLSENPCKVFKVKKWIVACSFSKEFVLTETTESTEENYSVLKHLSYIVILKI